MKWATVSDREKTRLILEHILKWTYFTDFDTYHSALWQTGEWVSVGNPVAFWSEDRDQWSVQYQDHEDGEIFDPLHSMDTACMLPESPAFFGANTEIVCVPMAYWRCSIDFHQRGVYFHGYAAKPAEAICIAFLRAVGIDIEELDTP